MFSFGDDAYHMWNMECDKGMETSCRPTTATSSVHDNSPHRLDTPPNLPIQPIVRLAGRPLRTIPCCIQALLHTEDEKIQTNL